MPNATLCCAQQETSCQRQFEFCASGQLATASAVPELHDLLCLLVVSSRALPRYITKRKSLQWVPLLFWG